MTPSAAPTNNQIILPKAILFSKVRSSNSFGFQLSKGSLRSKLSTASINTTSPNPPIRPVNNPATKSEKPAFGFSTPSRTTSFETTYPDTSGTHSKNRYPRLKVDSIRILLSNSTGKPTRQIRTWASTHIPPQRRIRLHSC